MLNDRFVGLSTTKIICLSTSGVNRHNGNRAAVSGSRRTMVYPSCLRSSPAIRSILVAPLNTRRPALLHLAPGPHLAVGAIQRSVHCSHHPSYLHSMPAKSHTRSRHLFFSEVFSFSISKGPVDKRCGSMREKINGKLNYLDQYFVGLVLGQRLAKDRAISSVPSIRRSDD